MGMCMSNTTDVSPHNVNERNSSFLLSTLNTHIGQDDFNRSLENYVSIRENSNSTQISLRNIDARTIRQYRANNIVNDNRTRPNNHILRFVNENGLGNSNNSEFIGLLLLLQLGLHAPSNDIDIVQFIVGSSNNTNSTNNINTTDPLNEQGRKKIKEIIVAEEDIYSECPICITEIVTGEVICKLQCECTNLCHLSCIDEWFKTKNTCPSCRINVNDS